MNGKLSRTAAAISLLCVGRIAKRRRRHHGVKWNIKSRTGVIIIPRSKEKKKRE
jgi:hypothetical protein